MYLIPGKYQWIWLLASSILFYSALSPSFLILFVALLALNYLLGLTIGRSDSRGTYYLFLGIFTNLLVLIFFKSFGLFQSLTADLKGFAANDPLLKVFLPAGLSFFIFTILSYLIEVRRQTVKAERHFGIFAVSMLFFPKLLQGPVEKPWNLFPQFREAKNFSYEAVTEGLKLMMWGYFKKLVVADRLAIYVNWVYGNNESHSGISLLLATILFSFQIYADFSGYTDIALGSARVLGFNLTNNFKRPYFATSMNEFLKRWHISLFVWFRDYLFLPLAAYITSKVNRKKDYGLASQKWIFIFAAIITFSIYGLWHGKMNYLIWAWILGICLTISNWAGKISQIVRGRSGITNKSTLVRIFGSFITFTLVTFSWIFFRSDSTQTALNIISGIIDLDGPLFVDKTTLFYGIAGLMLLLITEAKRELVPTSHWPFKRRHWFTQHLAFASLTIIILLIGVFNGDYFIYFQF
jgi:D-alanyl-lipoteichoic acid acyltransferase DltB (MBOAT superfamily)